jgi:hypothetical protein
VNPAVAGCPGASLRSQRRAPALSPGGAFGPRLAWAHADATIEGLPLDAVGHVPWWPAGRSEVTLHRVLVHVIAETNRHGGHADIVRELVDGSVGLRQEMGNMAPGDAQWWAAYRSRLEQVAQEAGLAP